MEGEEIQPERYGIYHSHIIYASHVPYGHLHQPVMGGGTWTLTLNQREGIEGRWFSLLSNIMPKLKSLSHII